jgi:hypothetical protein
MSGRGTYGVTNRALDVRSQRMTVVTANRKADATNTCNILDDSCRKLKYNLRAWTDGAGALPN